MSLKLMAVIGLSTAALAAGSAKATPNLVQNGGFESTVPGPNFDPAFQQNAFLGHGISDPAVWSYAKGNGAIYAAGAADMDGATQGGGSRYYLWGPNNPAPNSSNGLPATSPNLGNYLAGDSDVSVALEIFQTITGVAPGQYVLTFDYGAAQFRDAAGTLWNGDTHSSWQVTFAGQTQTTLDLPIGDLSIGDHGFSGWKVASFIYAVPSNTSGSEVLSFLAVGGPSGLPPAALLDGVSLVAAPEPAALPLMVVGLLGLGVARLRRRVKSVPI
jgi:hypothetical protein